MKVEEDSEKLAYNSIFKTQRSWHHVPSWQIDGEKNGNSDYFLGSKISADGDCSLEIERRFLLGRKAMTNLDSVLKSRDIILLTKV